MEIINDKKLIGSFLLISIAYFSGCSPVPLIQSPRIKDKLTLSASIKKDGGGLLYNNNEKSLVIEEVVPLFLKIGIKNRVELSGIIYSDFMNFPFRWLGNAKVNLFDAGDNDWRNLASALFLGSSGYYGRNENDFNNYCGLTFGTYIHDFSNNEIEIVVQASSASENRHFFEFSESRRIVSVQPAFGFVCRPAKGRMCYSVGFSYSYPVYSDVWKWQSNIPSSDAALYHITAIPGFCFMLEFSVVIGR